MKRTIRYLLYAALPEVLTITAALVVVIALNLFSDGGQVVSAYYTGIPLMLLVFALIYCSNLTVSRLHVALSMGCGRTCFFASAQVNILLFSALMTLYFVVTSRLYETHFSTTANLMWQVPWWLFSLCTVAASVMGMGVGLVIGKSRVRGALALIGVMMATIALFTVLMIAGENAWGDLEWILPMVLVAVVAVLEIVLWRSIRRVVVR